MALGEGIFSYFCWTSKNNDFSKQNLGFQNYEFSIGPKIERRARVPRGARILGWGQAGRAGEPYPGQCSLICAVALFRFWLLWYVSRNYNSQASS